MVTCRPLLKFHILGISELSGLTPGSTAYQLCDLEKNNFSDSQFAYLSNEGKNTIPVGFFGGLNELAAPGGC